jgi:hypothetical protein
MIAMVSNMRFLQFSSHHISLRRTLEGSNMNAVLCYSWRMVLIACLLLFTAPAAFAQQSEDAPPPQPNGQAAVDTVKFLAGGAVGLVMHESGHLLFDAIFDANPYVTGVHLGPVPFFAIAHRSDLSPRREFTISAAGFWVQESVDEWLLTRRPQLRDQHAWGMKGLLAFDVLNSVGYSLVAFAKAGPSERDTRGMADSIGIDERIIGALVLAPALLDSYRYFNRGSGWAAWTSRAVKVSSVLLVLKRTSSSRR